MADENNVQLEQILIEIQAYVDQLNQNLKTTIPKELCKTKESCEEILTLAGELNAYFAKQ